MLLPFRAAMFNSWLQSAIETPVLLHWLTKIWPLLMVGVADAAVLVLLVMVLVMLVVVAMVLDGEVLCDVVVAVLLDGEVLWDDVVAWDELVELEVVLWEDVEVEVAFHELLLLLDFLPFGAATAAMTRVANVRRVWGSMVAELSKVLVCVGDFVGTRILGEVG